MDVDLEALLAEADEEDFTRYQPPEIPAPPQRFLARHHPHHDPPNPLHLFLWFDHWLRMQHRIAHEDERHDCTHHCTFFQAGAYFVCRATGRVHHCTLETCQRMMLPPPVALHNQSEHFLRIADHFVCPISGLTRSHDDYELTWNDQHDRVAEEDPHEWVLNEEDYGENENRDESRSLYLQQEHLPAPTPLPFGGEPVAPLPPLPTPAFIEATANEPIEAPAPHVTVLSGVENHSQRNRRLVREAKQARKEQLARSSAVDEALTHALCDRHLPLWGAIRTRVMIQLNELLHAMHIDVKDTYHHALTLVYLLAEGVTGSVRGAQVQVVRADPQLSACLTPEHVLIRSQPRHYRWMNQVQTRVRVALMRLYVSQPELLHSVTRSNAVTGRPSRRLNQ